MIGRSISHYSILEKLGKLILAILLLSTAVVACSDDPEKPAPVDPSQFEGRFSGNTVVSEDGCNCNARPDTFDYVVDIDGDVFVLRTIDGQPVATGAWFQNTLTGIAAEHNVQKRCNGCEYAGFTRYKCVFTASDPDELRGEIRHSFTSYTPGCNSCYVVWTLIAKRLDE